jgi:hypothetical protein
LLCNSFHLILDAFPSLAAYCCCVESKVTGAGVSLDSLISEPRRVVCSALMMDLTCHLGRSWRSSRLPTSMVPSQSSLPYSATAWTHATLTASTLSATMLYVLVCDRILASAVLAFFMNRLWYSSNIRYPSSQTPCKHVACMLNRINPFPILICAVSCGRRCFLWPCLCVISAASVFAQSNYSPHLLVHSMRFAAHHSSIETTWLTSLPVATQPKSSTEVSTTTCDTYNSTHQISPHV